MAQVLPAFIESVRQDLGSRCKVLSDIGDFAYVVTIKFAERATIKIQFPSEFPEQAPVVICQEQRLVDAYQQWQAASYSLEKLHEILDELLNTFNVEAVAENSNSNTKDQSVSRRNKKADKGNTRVTESAVTEETEKKPRMRPVEDVVQRIQWDAEIDRRQVYVGYEDRFIGILEKKFDDYGFEVDVADSDERVPLHRIVYFRYGQRTVWNKHLRIDNVFGSTCEPGQPRVTIIDVIRELQEEQARQIN